VGFGAKPYKKMMCILFRADKDSNFESETRANSHPKNLKSNRTEIFRPNQTVCNYDL